MDILVTKQQLIELQHKLNPLIKKALIGNPIKPVTHFMQGLVPMGEETINESPDMAIAKNSKYNDDDAIGFGFLDGKAWVGYNDSLTIDGFDEKLQEFISKKPEFGTNIPSIKTWLKMHGGFKYFYEILGEECYLTRSSGKYNGRLWLGRKVMSFWEYPPKEELFRLLRLLKQEIKRIYNEDVDFNGYSIEIKTDKGISDLDWGEIIPIKQYVGSENATDDELKSVHLMPSDEKKNTPQMKSALDAKYKHIGDKLGDVTQAEYNHYKRYGMGESTLKESPDKVLNNYDDLLAHWSNDDAIAFGFLNDRAFIGYNNSLFFDSDKISMEKKNILDRTNYKIVEKMMAHAGISSFYKILYGENGIGSHRSQFEYPGRIWTVKRIISFWQYPDKNKLPQLLKSLTNEIRNIYGLDS